MHLIIQQCPRYGFLPDSPILVAFLLNEAGQVRVGIRIAIGDFSH
jgi:hypothetical protein